MVKLGQGFGLKKCIYQSNVINCIRIAKSMKWNFGLQATFFKVKNKTLKMFIHTYMSICTYMHTYVQSIPLCNSVIQ